MTQYRTRLVGRKVYVSRPATKAEAAVLGAESIVLPAEIPDGIQPNLRHPDVQAMVQAMKDGFDEIAARMVADRESS